jgi:hypothetical protein
MPQPTPSTAWWQKLRARRSAPGAPDAAEMGTAFGLEMSLPPLTGEPVRPVPAPRRAWWARARRR